MGQSNHLRYKELRTLFHLLGECCELGADPLAWREHLAKKLPEVFAAQVGVYTEFAVIGVPLQDPHWVRPLAIIDHGWSTLSDRKPFEEQFRDGPDSQPHITPDLPQRRLKVFHWSGDLGRAEWQRSKFFNEVVKPTNQHDGLFAHHLIRPNQLWWLVVTRGSGDKPFRLRERRLMTALNAELAQLVGVKLARLGEAGVIDLPPRARQVLLCLMEGDSEKQVARRLGISQHTVHDHVKQLHARFGVASRGELLARCRSFWPVLESLVNADDPVSDAIHVTLDGWPVVPNHGNAAERGAVEQFTE